MNIEAKPWTRNTPPHKILAIRLQAMGDLVITLPYLQQLRTTLPSATVLDLLTKEEVNAIPKNIHLFSKVYSIAGGRDIKKQLLSAAWLLPKLLLQRYDVVIDLQNNMVSRLIRKSLMPRAWASFDRFSAIAAGERTRLTIEAAGMGDCCMKPGLKLKNKHVGIELLKANGWNPAFKLVILNPAGAFKNRNWPIHNYVSFAQLWLQQFPETQFLITGTDFIAAQALYLKKELGHHLIDLVNNSTVLDAFAIIQKAKLVVSEDSGLMHMAWVSGIPTLAIFGSTRSDWARPLGDRTSFFDSTDLVCGSCMQRYCRYSDNHCITRYTPEMVFEKAVLLIR